MHYVSRGEGPPLVYVHGAKGSVYDSHPLGGDRLSGRYEAVAMDRPGSGSAPGPPGATTRPRPRRRCCAPRPFNWGSERPILLGDSFGAAVALAWALAAPEDVAAVVTLGGYVLPLGGPPPWWSRYCAALPRCARWAPSAAPARGARWWRVP